MATKRLAGILSIFLALSLMLSLFPVSALAGEGDATITFDSKGGGSVAAATVATGGKLETLPRPASPSPGDTMFIGWFTDPAAEGHMWDCLNDTVDGSLTLYAKWVTVDATHLLLNAYATEEELASPYVAATLQTLPGISANEATLTLAAGTTVYVAPGVYWTNTDYKLGFPFDDSGYVINRATGLTVSGSNLNFIGLTDDAMDVQICGNRGEGGANGLGYTGSWYAIRIGAGFTGKNITFANYAQQSLVYPRDPAQNWPLRIDSKNHAEVLGGGGDKCFFENMRFVGYLNMMANFSAPRAYFKDCFIQCTDDSIFGGGILVYENCEFNFFQNHPTWTGTSTMSALLGCKVIGTPQMTTPELSLAKQANQANSYAIIDTEFGGRIETVVWENNVGDNVRHYVSNNSLRGEPFTISESKPYTSVDLTGTEALKAFKVGDEYNVYNLLKGTDGWDPKGQKDDPAMIPYANLPYKFRVAATGATLNSDQTGAGNRAVLTPALTGGSADLSTGVWSYDEDLLTGTVGANGVLTLAAKPNNSNKVIKTIATITLPSGFSAGSMLSINPVPIAEVPAAADTAIEIGDNLATLSYTLPRDDLHDISVIDWYREAGPDTTDGVHIGTNRVGGAYIDSPYKEYALSKYDVGYYLRAVITPKYEFGSTSGSPVTVYTDRAITQADVTDSELILDFKNMYIANAANTTKGRMFFDFVSGSTIPWVWGLGTNGAEGLYGLQNANGGTNSRMVFGQSGAYGDMSFDLNLTPGKVEGQGFGGNGQFMDIYVKYDPETRTGYGVRFERVSRLGLNGVEWRLYKYDGNTSPRNPVSSASGRYDEEDRASGVLLAGPVDAAISPNTSISVSVTGNTLRVKSTTETEGTPDQIANNIPNMVDFSWTDPTGDLSKNTFGGFGVRIQNSGTPNINGGAGTNNCMMLLNARVSATAITTVTFDYNGGTGTEMSREVSAGEAYGELPVPAAREEYIFLGWSTDGTEDGIVTAETIVSGSHTLTALWEEDMSDGKIRVKLGGTAALTTEGDGEYTLSAANLNKLATATVWFEVDGDYFEGKSVQGLNGFDVLGGIVWENTSGSLWSGRVTLTNMTGSVSSDSYLELLKLTLGAKEVLGDTAVKITRIELSGYDGDNKAVFFESILRRSEVETSVVEYFSPYDINRDGKIDQLDLTTAQLYYAAREGDSDWDEAKIADVNGDGRVDIEDLILILNNIVW